MLSRVMGRIRRRSFAERYLATAAVVWVVYGSLSALLLQTGLTTWVAGGSAYICALVLHFSLHRFVVFRRDELNYHHDLSAQVWRYLLTAVAQYAFTLAGTAFIVRETDLHRAPAYVACAAFAAVCNFVVLRLLVFRHSSTEAAPIHPVPALRVPPGVRHGEKEPV